MQLTQAEQAKLNSIKAYAKKYGTAAVGREDRQFVVDLAVRMKAPVSASCKAQIVQQQYNNADAIVTL